MLQYVVVYLKTFLSGWHVLLDGMYYRRVCLAVGDVLLEYMFYRWMKTVFTGGYVL